MKVPLPLLMTFFALVACTSADQERFSSLRENLDFVCPAGCTCSCEGGSGGAAGSLGASGRSGASGAGGSTAGSGNAAGAGGSAPRCDLSAFTTGVWRKTLGQPSSSSGTGIVLDPSNPGTVYVGLQGYGSADGVFRSQNCGATWTELGNFIAPQQVRVNPANPNELYVGAGVGTPATNGFYYSSNRGASWVLRAYPSTLTQQFNDTYHIGVDPTNFDHALVSFHYPGSNQYNAAGILETFNKGATWREIAPISAWANQAGTTIEFLYDPATGQGNAQTWLYGTQAAGFWRTTNSGATWTQVSTRNQTHGGNSLYYASNGTLYSGSAYHPMRSVNNGASWTELTGTTYGYFQAVGGDGVNLYTFQWGGGRMNTSTEASNGATWNTNGVNIPGGPFEFTRLDRVNRIMYVSAWEGGVWAVKVP